jgi:signal recognition particle subunit SEC65
MKKLIIISLVSVCLYACNSSGAADEKKNAANIELIKNYVKAVEELNYQAMADYLDDIYIGMGPSYGDTVRKTEAVENWKSNVANLYEKIHYNRSRFAAVTIPDGDNKGDWVTNWAELNIKYKNGGNEVTIWANTSYQVENGKILKSFTVYNEADALRQLGYKIVAPDKLNQ